MVAKDICFLLLKRITVIEWAHTNFLNFKMYRWRFFGSIQITSPRRLMWSDPPFQAIGTLIKNASNPISWCWRLPCQLKIFHINCKSSAELYDSKNSSQSIPHSFIHFFIYIPVFTIVSMHHNYSHVATVWPYYIQLPTNSMEIKSYPRKVANRAWTRSSMPFFLFYLHGLC